MIGARINNGDTPSKGRDVYGIVTTGNSWQFGKLHNEVLSRPLNSIDAIGNLQKIINIVNWVINTAKMGLNNSKHVQKTLNRH